MARIEERSGAVVVRFDGWEPLFTGRAQLEVPFAAVREVDVVDNGLRATRGGRVGLLVTGFRKIGRWGLGAGVRQLVSVRRGQPALRLRLDRATAGYDEVLVCVPDVAAAAELVREGARTSSTVPRCP